MPAAEAQVLCERLRRFVSALSSMWSSTIAIEKLLLALSSAIATSTASASSRSVGVTGHWGNDKGTNIADVFRLLMVVQGGGQRTCTLLPMLGGARLTWTLFR